MFLVRIRSNLAFEMRFVDVKRIQATLWPSPKIQDGGQKEGTRGKFKIRFTK